MAPLPVRRSPHPEFEARIQSALEERKRAERVERPDRGRGLYLSEIGHCPRKLWAQTHGHKHEDMQGRSLVIFDMGSKVEDLVISWLRTAGYTVRREQDRLVMEVGEGLQASGHIDGEIWLGDRFETYPAILEIKSANDEQWNQCVALGYDVWRPAYGDTLHSYMGASGVHVAMAFVLNKNNSRLYAEKLRFDAARYERLKAKAGAVLTSERPLPRPEAATSEFCEFCKWCHLAEWCHGSTADVRFDP